MTAVPCFFSKRGITSHGQQLLKREIISFFQSDVYIFRVKKCLVLPVEISSPVPEVDIPYRSCMVALCPPGLWWVEVPTPQLPVKALGRQRVLLNLKGVVLDVVKRWRNHSGPVLLYSLQNGFRPAGQARVKKTFLSFNNN